VQTIYLPSNLDEQKFLQIYFMGNSENEIKIRLSIAPKVNKYIFYDLQLDLSRLDFFYLPTVT
jgi:hypothetical protein